MDGLGTQSAPTVKPALAQEIRVEPREIERPDLLQLEPTDARSDVQLDVASVCVEGAPTHLVLGRRQPLVNEIFVERQFGWLDVGIGALLFEELCQKPVGCTA